MKVDGSCGSAVAVKSRWEAAGRRRAGGVILRRRRTKWRVQRGDASGAAASRTTPPLQRLLAACRGAFRGPGTVPAPADVSLIRGILDKIRPEDLHLNAKHEFFKVTDSASAGSSSERYPPITRTTIYSCTNFSIVVFVLPPAAVIPLHNHPGMTVFSKLLLGSLHVKSYDWTDPAAVVDSTAGDRLRLAKLVLDANLTAPCDALVLYPESGGNMHRFAAATPCAVLDVLGPEYSEDRDCTYYRDFPFSHNDPGPGTPSFCCSHRLTTDEQNTTGIAENRQDKHITDEQKRRLAWLEETGKPEDLEMYEVPYRGRRIL